MHCCCSGGRRARERSACRGLVAARHSAGDRRRVRGVIISYGRAQARGRDSLFGKVVTKGEVWTPGANASTTMQVSRDVTVGGKSLPAGKYSVWMVSDPSAPWTLYFHTNATLFHTRHPRIADMALAVPVQHTSTGEHVEMLTFDRLRGSDRRR